MDTDGLRVPILSDQQIDTFKRDGFVHVPGAFDAESASRFDHWTAEIAARPEAPGDLWVYHERSKLDRNRELICRIENISPFHEGFRQLAKILKQPVAQLLGEPCTLFKEKINFKMPGGDGFQPHQDSQAGWERYANYFITAMVCIDAATEANGCLKVAPGFQSHPLYREWEPLTEDDMRGMTFKPCPTQPGDLMFIDTYAPHASEPNLTNQTRRLYFATYNRLREGNHLASYYADKRKSYPPDIERDPGKRYVFRV